MKALRMSMAFDSKGQLTQKSYGIVNSIVRPPYHNHLLRMRKNGHLTILPHDPRLKEA